MQTLNFAKNDLLPGFPLLAAPIGKHRVYAITFDLDADTLHQVYPNESWRNTYGEIRRILIEEGFEWQQGSVYFGSPERIDAVRCVLAAQRLAQELPWFSEAVRDIRMLRIEENNDLSPLLAPHAKTRNMTQTQKRANTRCADFEPSKSKKHGIVVNAVPPTLDEPFAKRSIEPKLELC